jgi:mannose-6-phosphate isomerase-like protein (cupin superfamily)
MTSVIVESDRLGGPLPFDILFDQNDGATRIWMTRVRLPETAPGEPPPPRGAGLHRHEGDEIWRVRRGRIRMVVGEERFECGAGELVVVPPNTIHGTAIIDDDTECEVIGELQMGEWITVIDSDGNSREVEVHMPLIPWHRPLPEGEAQVSVEDMIAMMQSTAHLI